MTASNQRVATTDPGAQRLNVQYPGGIAARYRWTGSGGGPALFAISESAGELTDHGALVDAEPDRLCRLELHVESPAGAWTARFASVIHDVLHTLDHRLISPTLASHYTAGCERPGPCYTRSGRALHVLRSASTFARTVGQRYSRST